VATPNCGLGDRISWKQHIRRRWRRLKCGKFNTSIMRLTMHTDYGLRFLIYAALQMPRAASVKEIATAYGASADHMMKVARALSKAGLIRSCRGRSGGFKLADEPRNILVGDVVRRLESCQMVECMRKGPSACPISAHCQLPRLLETATKAYFSVLDSATLADLIGQRKGLEIVLRVISA